MSVWSPAPPPKTLRGKLNLWWWKFRNHLRWRLMMMFPRWGFSKVKLPVIKRTFPPIDAKSFTETQPMTVPDGLVVQMKIKYGKNDELERIL